ncbi:permease [Nocardioides cheoyonin]|uniref:permease n=1 Tax=Nocardioides cheoyonin TaxID=3156615 RepID=UPI0032B580E3
MTETLLRADDGGSRDRRIRLGLAGVAVLAVLLVVGLSWAKWLPYAEKVRDLAASRSWSGSALFLSAGQPGDLPSLAGAWDFTTDYFTAVWKAAVVALVVAAALDSLVPRQWTTRMLTRRTILGQSSVGALLSLPCMMCTCCTAPVAVGLRRRGAPLGATLAYWLGNPLLNPAVIVFLALVLPWQYAAVRVLLGALLVVGASAYVAGRLDGRSVAPADPDAVTVEGDAPVTWRALPVRFLRSLARFALVLVPEYVVVVLLTGWLSGWLSDFSGAAARLGVVAVLTAAVVGALLVIPTGGEIPVVVAAVAAGAGSGVAGALLVTLPALSLPSIVMVGRALSWKATAAMAGTVVAGGVLAGGLLAVLV